MKLFDLYAGLSLDASEFNNGIKQAASVGESFQGNVTAISAKAVALGHALYDVGKQAVQMAANLAKSVVTEYADTEQLLGGVDTIFKADGQSVIDNAARAFRTAGMSANEYMETVTGFSSSLLQGLDGDNPTQTADEIKAAISGWWEGTARPVIESTCQWVLAFPNMPDETKAEAEAIVHTWWEQTGSWISNACSWTLQMFNVPTESAEEVAALVEAWWEGIYDTVQGICKIGLSLAFGNVADAIQAIKDWWTEVKDTVAESISIGFTLHFPNIPAIVQSIKDWWANVTGAKEANANVEADLTLPDATSVVEDIVIRRLDAYGNL